MPKRMLLPMATSLRRPIVGMRKVTRTANEAAYPIASLTAFGITFPIPKYSVPVQRRLV
jgi:hypothetical protein